MEEACDWHQQHLVQQGLVQRMVLPVQQLLFLMMKVVKGRKKMHEVPLQLLGLQRTNECFAEARRKDDAPQEGHCDDDELHHRRE